MFSALGGRVAGAALGYPMVAEISDKAEYLAILFFLLAVALTGVNIWFQTHGEHVVIRNAGFAERLLGAAPSSASHI